MANNNKILGEAKTNIKDEFYTQLSDIENELRHYKEHFRDRWCCATATIHVCPISSSILR